MCGAWLHAQGEARSSSLDERGVLRRIRYGCIIGPQDLEHTTRHRGQVRGDFGSARTFGNLVRLERHRSAAWSESLDRRLQRTSAKNGREVGDCDVVLPSGGGTERRRFNDGLL